MKFQGGGSGTPGPAGVAGADGAAGVGGQVPGGYAEISANVGPITAIADVAGLSVTVTGNNQPMMVEVWVGAVQNSIAASGVTVYITDDLNSILSRGDTTCNTINVNYGPMVVKYKVPAFTGNKTFKVRGQQLVSGNVTLIAGTARKAYIEVTYR